MFVRRLFPLVASIGLACLAMFGAWCTALDLRVAPTIELSRSLLSGKIINGDHTRRMVEKGVGMLGGPRCRSDLDTAAGIVMISTIDQIVAKAQVDLVEPSLKTLEAVSRGMLACSPGDGFAWFLLAIARDAGGADDRELRLYFEHSVWAAPSENWIVRSRVQEMAKVASRRGPFIDDLIRQDVATLLVHSRSIDDVAEAISDVYRWIPTIVQEEFRRVTDPERRSAIIQAFGRQDVNIAACPIRAFNDWVYRGWFGTCEGGDKIPDFDWRKAR